MYRRLAPAFVCLFACGAPSAPPPSAPAEDAAVVVAPADATSEDAAPLDATSPDASAPDPQDASSLDASTLDASALDAATPPVDCEPLRGVPGVTLCRADATRCEAVFEDSRGCRAVCALAGLHCAAGYEDVDGQCAPDMARPALGCGDTNHMSDYCVCAASACNPDCTGRVCGDDGCGGSCGECQTGSCQNGQCGCAPRTCERALLECGAGHDDGCGGTFDCPAACPPGLPCLGGFCGFGPGSCTGASCPAFPGAEGEGSGAVGGRGGDVYHVTSLSNSGAGTLRAGVESTGGARTVVFDVGGFIELTAPLRIRRSRLTIAGQTAPGDGITIRGYQTEVHANDVIIQHVRFRPGDIRKKTQSREGFTEDSLTINGRRVVIDHVTAMWGIDENLSGGAEFDDLTVQYSIIAEGLHRTRLHHGEYVADHRGHSMGSLFKPSIGDASMSIHHNLYAHSNNRNPAIGSYEDTQTVRADVRNNVIYDCPGMGYSSGESRRLEVNYVGNYAVWGPTTNDRGIFDSNANNAVRLFQLDNRRDMTRNRIFDGRDDGWTSFPGDYARQSSPYTFAPVTTQPSAVAIELVLAWAGARPWDRDAVDLRIVGQVRAGTGRIIDSQDDVGGYGTPRTGPRVVDTDRDGMPDDFERLYGTDPQRADHNGDLDGDGYTNLERYLRWAARPR